MSNEQKRINTVEPKMPVDLSKTTVQETPKGAARFTPPVYDDVDEHGLDVALLEELSELNLDYRMIDFKQAKLNGGRSRSGWIVYKRQSVDPRLAGIQSLADPDGLVRDGSLVLAVKPRAAADRQRARRDAQNKTLRKYTQTVTQELDGQARKLGGSSRIVAGYDKNS